ncbi:5-bromo-4-chloroindolyl phosphate hydrolysis family protein [Blautia stercoris]|uniref:5-bromo-4-chloroindolyl phosphate hydrolysis family protein n=1 Tax=Blautia stercoris TaxID=871664 RepID=A0ABR7P909_9FIRM|nr:5-bromo-4-chloroindolyl phosphate hydrolysis family protein [Blautia stercoris]MBC8627882.1 5-bromo-4-chloroindolyl phosphate hydrolysis family protein [Blautia stercoris]
MPKNDWNQLGNDIKNIVQDAIETGDYGRLNRDLGVTLENALGNMATSVKDAAIKNLNHFSGSQQTANQRRTVSPERQRQEQNMRGYKKKLVKEAREKFALYVNTSTPRALGILFTILGVALVGMFGVTAATLGIAGVFIDAVANKMQRGMFVFIAAIVASGALGIYGNTLRKKVNRFRSYVRTLNGKTYVRIEELAKGVRKSPKFVKRDLKKMIKNRMFLEGHLDEEGNYLITSDESYEQYMQTKKASEIQEREMQEKEQAEQKLRGTLSEEVQEVIKEGEAYLEEIRSCNEAIPGVEISNKMYHLENVILRIFKRVEQHPELISDLHKFMDYYLPTTVKLLKAYEELDKQPVEGENIKTAKQEIENTLDTINEAFENLLDSFFRNTAWDVSTDISVLKTMLAQEGLTGNKDFESVSGKEN